ncbi:MAG: glutathione S-transferase [Pseudomonadales bacterium]|jgi:glutathione S-transferase
MITLHGNSVSPYVRKVLAVLQLKKLAFEQTQQMPFSADEEFKKISPLGKIPALQDGDTSICDSTVICEYLDDAYPQCPVYPSDPKDKAHARWIEELCGNQITEQAAGIFFQRFMRPMVLKQETDEELVEKIINKRLPPLLNYMETQVPAEGYLFGKDIGVADISIVTPFVNAGYAGYEVDSTTWPKLASFMARVKEHPVMAELLKAEAVMMGRG